MSPPTPSLQKRSTTSTPANASTTPSPSNSTTLNAFASTPDGSLSIGAKAGIALAALIITALILVAILFLMKRKKQTRKASMAAGAPLARDQSNESSVSGADGLEKRGGNADVQVVRAG